jgi:OHCU decarboxylase
MLIRAHPDLASRAELTEESSREQTSVGLNRLAPEEAAVFQEKLAAYRDRFEFPFVVCARLNRKESIMAALVRRLENSSKEERINALEEIFKIADLRLRDLASD